MGDSIADVCSAYPGLPQSFAAECCDDMLSGCTGASLVCFSNCNDLCGMTDFSCALGCTGADKQLMCTECPYASGFFPNLEPICSEFLPNVEFIDSSCLGDAWKCGDSMDTFDTCNAATVGFVCDGCYNGGNHHASLLSTMNPHTKRSHSFSLPSARKRVLVQLQL
jgi:hypothetical protein